jgi:uncharacterized protein YwgA
MFILQDIAKANFGYKFIIYKHGPYSFDLSNELTEMRASGILELSFLKDGYGPSVRVTEFGERVFNVNKENVEKYDPAAQFLAEWFSASDVRHLERIATAYFVTAKNPRDPAIERARKLNSLKPHVDMQTAEQAMRIVDEKRQEVKRQLAVF